MTQIKAMRPSRACFKNPGMHTANHIDGSDVVTGIGLRPFMGDRAVRRVGLYGIDLLLVLAASILSFALRENFELTWAKWIAFQPYLLCTMATASLVVPMLGLPRSIWRFSTMADYLHLALSAVAIVLGAVLTVFVVNRLDGVARSIPILQTILIVVFLVGARVFMRIRHAGRRAPVKQFGVELSSDGLLRPSILIVGVNRLTELFLQSAQEFNGETIRVAGLIGSNARHTGRLMHRFPILGTAEELPEILKQQQVHGIVIDRVVVTEKVSSLTPEARAILMQLQQASDIRVDFLAASLGLDSVQGKSPSPLSVDPAAQAAAPNAILVVGDDEQRELRQRPFWRFKRAVDVVGAVLLLVLLSPVLAAVAFLVLLDVGLPLVFWQQRPGLGGRPFKVYKFRTMGPAHDGEGNPIPDQDRVSVLGKFLRRSRIDELPQLANILAGQMSFVGPRPLLPVDQEQGSQGRLLVRPGLTGWAQVKGGRHLSALDKAALDIWYVRNASFAVDCEVVLRTIGIVLFGEKQNDQAVRQAWDEVQKSHAAFIENFPGKSTLASPSSGDQRVA